MPICYRLLVIKDPFLPKTEKAGADFTKIIHKLMRILGIMLLHKIRILLKSITLYRGTFTTLVTTVMGDFNKAFVYTDAAP